MDAAAAFAREVRRQVGAARTSTSQGKVTAVAGGEVSFTIGADPTPITGRWVGATAPAIGEVVTWLNDGSGYPIVFGATGKDSLGTLYQWAVYTPSWTCEGAPPSIGNGSLVGRYARASQWVMVEIHLKAGFATNYGSGTMRFGLPLIAANNGDFHQIEGHVHDAGIGWFPLTGLIPSTAAHVVPMLHATLGTYVTLGYLTATSPVNLGDADAIHLKGIYRTV